MERTLRKGIFVALLLLLLVPIGQGSILDRLLGLVKLTAEKVRGWDLSLHEAMWYKKLPGGKVQCELCPFRCTLDEGERGICGVRVNIKGTLRSLTYGKPAALNIDPIEKKPLFHFLPGSKALSVATVGCNLSCNFCQNWTLSQSAPEDAPHQNVSPEELVRKAIDTGCQSIAYTYSEPSVWYEYMFDTAVEAHKKGIKNVWVTCGYINEAPLRQLAKYLDAANVDLKGDAKFYRDYTRSSVAPVKRTLVVLKEMGVWVEVTNLLIPGANDSPEQIREVCRFVKDSLGADTPLHFSRFHPDYKLKDRTPTPMETLEMAYQIAKDEGLKYVYIGNVPGSTGENTYCPSCHKLVIGRLGYTITNYKLKNGKCEHCGCPIDGVWK